QAGQGAEATGGDARQDVTGALTQGPRRLAHGATVSGPLDHLGVIGGVADGPDVLAGDAEMCAESLQAPGLGGATAADLEAVVLAEDDVEAVGPGPAQGFGQRREILGLADAHDLAAGSLPGEDAIAIDLDLGAVARPPVAHEGQFTVENPVVGIRV